MVRYTDTAPKDLTSYARFFKRRKKSILITFFLIFFIVCTIAFSLPSIYRSTATILIEGQEVPPEFIKSTVTGYLEERLQAITQQIMSRPSLLEVINRFNLYTDLRDKYTVDEIVEKMRKDIKIETITAQAPSPHGGRPISATIAFTISYEGKRPDVVQRVTNYLASLYLEENLRNREEKAKGTTQFLESQLEMLKEQIANLDRKIAAFKKEHLGELPELMQLNVQTLRRLDDEISRIDQQIQNLEERKVYLQGQLVTIDPYSSIITESGQRILTPEKRLEILKSQYVTLIATRSPKHPDVIKVKREIENLEKEVKVRKDLENKIKRHEDLKSELAQLQGVLSDKHPYIKSLKRKIASLEKEIKQSSERLKTVIDTNPDNPAYINLSTQISSIELEIKNLKAQREKLREKIKNYEKRLEKMPEIERKYQAMLRDKANAEARYRELMNQLMEAKSAEGLEESQKGEHFSIIDPPHLPEKPYKPNRPAIIIIGLILALGGSIGVGSIIEYTDRSVKDATDIATITDVPVLVVLPIIETEEEKREKRRKKIIYATLIAIAIVIFVAVIHIFFTRLDILWYKILRW
ncbi:MAG TPA: lipopolysaccharide biosynthesis protein [Candidatus Aerophobetes bacterium]|uniref:Lipopolysaccharide biosynthesis protein n=1 Tax=Aerophobetes bacterium TaxID=2030807 RepID=A0A7V0N0F9_UNCAE|nr:lipopolysaccharide biosynthesis protein [Candidatus Aerophobetes bacterium]